MKEKEKIMKQNSSNSLYIVSFDVKAGSLISIVGIAEFLSTKVEKLAFFKPIIKDKATLDPDIELLQKRYEIDVPYSESYGFCVEEIKELVADDKLDFVIESIMQNLKNFKKNMILFYVVAFLILN